MSSEAHSADKRSGLRSFFVAGKGLGKRFFVDFHLRKWLALIPWCFVAMDAAGKGLSSELLKQLAEHDARMDQIEEQASFTTDTLTEELDRSGDVTHTLELVLRTLHLEGKKTELLGKALKDGKDVTPEYREKFKGPSRPQGSELQFPFGAKMQSDYLFREVGPDPSNPSLLRIRFEPKGTWTDKLMVGEAVVDPVQGEVTRILAQQSAPPSNTDFLNLDFAFDAATPLGRALSKVLISGEGGFLFIKSRFRHTIVYSGYDLSAISTPAVAKDTKR